MPVVADWHRLFLICFPVTGSFTALRVVTPRHIHVGVQHGHYNLTLFTLHSCSLLFFIHQLPPPLHPYAYMVFHIADLTKINVHECLLKGD